MEWGATLDELKPVTMDNVISPVPMNPSCIILSYRFPNGSDAQILNDFQKHQTVFVSIYPATGEGLTLRESPATGSDSEECRGRASIAPAKQLGWLRPSRIPANWVLFIDNCETRCYQSSPDVSPSASRVGSSCYLLDCVCPSDSGSH